MTKWTLAKAIEVCTAFIQTNLDSLDESEDLQAMACVVREAAKPFMWRAYIPTEDVGYFRSKSEALRAGQAWIAANAPGERLRLQQIRYGINR